MSSMSQRNRSFHAQSPAEVAEQLATNLQRGLTQAEAERRLSVHGPNRLPEEPPDPAWLRLLRQFHNPLIYVLLVAGILTAYLGHWIDAAVIFAVVIVSAVLGAIQEGKAQRALAAVKSMLARTAVVVRDGRRHQIAAEELVPGDLVFLESGMVVPADLRLVSARQLAVDEAALTGESLPVEKNPEPVDEATPLAERRCMAYSGTTVVRGQGLGVVVATGGDSELGRIGELVATVTRLETPLTRRLTRFAQATAAVIVALSALLFAWAYWGLGQAVDEIFLAVVGIAVAAIPEGLPAIVTIILAIGGQRLAQHRAIVRRLPAVETLGSVTVICTDKTGTLTRNELTVTSVLLPHDAVEVTGSGYEPEGEFVRGGRPRPPESVRGLVRLARAALLCNDATLHTDAEGNWHGEGDPLEIALLSMALKAGLDPEREHGCWPRVDLIPFESERRWMATLNHDHHGNHVILLKGAPEVVLAHCLHDADGQPLDVASWEERLMEEAAKGRRRRVRLTGGGGARGSTAAGGEGCDPRVPRGWYPRRDDHGRSSGDGAGHRRHAGAACRHGPDWHGDRATRRRSPGKAHRRDRRRRQGRAGEQAAPRACTPGAGSHRGHDRRRGQRRAGAAGGRHRRGHGPPRHRRGTSGFGHGARRRQLRHHRRCRALGARGLRQHQESVALRVADECGSGAGGGDRAGGGLVAADLGHADSVGEPGDGGDAGDRRGVRVAGADRDAAPAAPAGRTLGHRDDGMAHRLHRRVDLFLELWRLRPFPRP
jgi:hypothetical protein